MTDAESLEYQEKEWVAGRPWHNPVRDECCPDFSCCRPDFMWPTHAREAFVKADKDTRERMMLGALGGLVPVVVHVVDPDTHTDHDTH